MIVIKGKNMEDAYRKAIREVIIYGDEVSPRGSKTKEIAPATIVIEDARQFLTAPPSRRINPCFGLAETLWFLRGSDDLEEIAHYNSIWRRFEDCDNKGKLNGAYGKRLRNWNGVDQIEEVYKKLKKDPDSRQAITIIFNPELDNKIHCDGNYSKDIPCTSYFNFHIRNGKLNMHVVMRSNDLHKGFVYDAHNFMIIQNILAGWLDVEVGKYTHTASSLHIYESDINNMFEVLEDKYWIYEDDKELLSLKVGKEEFEQIMNDMMVVEALARNNSKIATEIKPFVEIMEFASKHIKNEFWLSIAGCLAVYNARKAKLPKKDWQPLVEKYITSEYRELFLKLTDLSKQ